MIYFAGFCISRYIGHGARNQLCIFTFVIILRTPKVKLRQLLAGLQSNEIPSGRLRLIFPDPCDPAEHSAKTYDISKYYNMPTLLFSICIIMKTHQRIDSKMVPFNILLHFERFLYSANGEAMHYAVLSWHCNYFLYMWW